MSLETHFWLYLLNRRYFADFSYVCEDMGVYEDKATTIRPQTWPDEYLVSVDVYSIIKYVMTLNAH